MVGHNLRVPVSSFVGRLRELGRVHDLLESHRLVTLTGAGGCGKSRLAVELCWSYAGAATGAGSPGEG
ncbi:ATP-binding protein [Dactylosporangium sp. NBC_01737]|uniref:AAA family ATPase n=1 Tax=Dactylosporangium sp. NBC_01737 TaxID=2975959 RepID=UPI002E11ED12|nr:ATP-binding protein [Dactylosporangium sp. NBC_01737]